MMMWDKVEGFLRQWEPQFVIMNCGADGLDGDPLAHLHYTARAHSRAARGLCQIAEEFAEGAFSPLAAAATSYATSPRHGPPWWTPSWKPRCADRFGPRPSSSPPTNLLPSAGYIGYHRQFSTARPRFRSKQRAPVFAEVANVQSRDADRRI